MELEEGAKVKEKGDGAVQVEEEYLVPVVENKTAEGFRRCLLNPGRN